MSRGKHTEFALQMSWCKSYGFQVGLLRKLGDRWLPIASYRFAEKNEAVRRILVLQEAYHVRAFFYDRNWPEGADTPIL